MGALAPQVLEKGTTPKTLAAGDTLPLIPSERRRVPRVNLALPVVVQPTGTSAKAVNLSETGMCLSSKAPLSDSISRIRVRLPKEVIEAEVGTAWVTRDKAGDRYVAGLQFRNLTEADTLKLREALLRYQTRRLLKRAKDSSRRGLVNNFILEKLFGYVTRIISSQARDGFDQVYSLKIQEELSRMSDELVQEGNRLEGKIDDKLMLKQLKTNFRRLLGHWIYQSEVMRRGFEKPNGYPGDYYLLEWIYSNKPVSKSAIGMYFDGYFLNNPYANAVRNRKDAMGRILWRSISAAQRPLHILNIACGSCREIRDVCLDSSLSVRAPITFSCFDQDRPALDFTKQTLVDLPSASRSKVQFKFIEGDVLNFSKDPQHFKDLFGHPDVIYSIGLADYLPDRVLRNVLKFCCEILAPGGRLIVAFKDKGQDEFAPLPPDWFCDWKFIPRTSEDIRSIVDGCRPADSEVTLEWEWSKKIVFVTVQKG